MGTSRDIWLWVVPAVLVAWSCASTHQSGGPGGAAAGSMAAGGGGTGVDSGGLPVAGVSSGAGTDESKAGTGGVGGERCEAVDRCQPISDAGPLATDADAGDVSTVPLCIVPPALPEGSDCSTESVGAVCRYGLGNDDSLVGICRCLVMNGAKVWLCAPRGF